MTVELLLARGVSVNTGKTFFMDLTMDLPQGAVILNLLVSTSNFEGNPAERGKLIRMLLKKGADVNRQDYWGRTAAMEAARQGQFDSLRLFLSNTDLTLLDGDGQTTLSHLLKCRRYGFGELFDPLQC